MKISYLKRVDPAGELSSGRQIGYDIALLDTEAFMSLDSEAVKRIAWLARLSIDEDKIADYARDLSGILDFVEQMNAVDTGHAAPLAHPLEQSQRLRCDEVSEPDQRDLFQQHAPAVEAGLYLVPKVIE
jgi:aspartyl-tRNA(Asn)/glutamyl-tRNA(Gln) amidotransferase subunit C